MAAIDPTSDIGKIRLRIGDWQDMPILPDVVIQGAINDCAGNIYRASTLCAQYVLATLSSKVHKRHSQLEVWSGEQFNNYLKFLNTIIKDPAFSMVAPIPYSGVDDGSEGAMKRFIDSWKAGYNTGSYVTPPLGPGEVIEYEYGI